MNRTKIDYLTRTWNPYCGCTGVGCAIADVCWARGQSKRQKHSCQQCYDFVPHPHLERLTQPVHARKGQRIGVCFKGDLFCRIEDRMMFFLIARVIEETPQHTYVMLTKQPQNLPLNVKYPTNLWVGVTVNKKEDLWRIDSLRLVNPHIRFVSFEPLLEDLGDVNLAGIGWIIIGAQTRPKLLPNPEWARKLIFAAYERKIPVWLKSNMADLTADPKFYLEPNPSCRCVLEKLPAEVPLK